MQYRPLTEIEGSDSAHPRKSRRPTRSFSPDCHLFKKTSIWENNLFKNVGTLENLGPAGQIISQESEAALYWGCPLLLMPSIGAALYLKKPSI